MEKLLEILKEFKEENKIEDYGFSEYLYWNSVPVIYLNNGGYIYLAKTHSEDGTTNLWTLDNLKDENKIKEKITEIVDKQDDLLECCINDLTKMEYM